MQIVDIYHQAGRSACFPIVSIHKIGAVGGNRNRTLLYTKQVLFRLSYQGNSIIAEESPKQILAKCCNV